MNKKKILSGSLIFTIAQFGIKIVSILYLIPFNSMANSNGANGMALFNYGYVPFAIFLSLTTAGIPMGISRLVAKYKAKNDLDSAYKIYRIGKNLLFILGIIGFVLLFILSDLVAHLVVPKTDANLIPVVSNIIKFSSIAIIFVPSLSIQTGFLQANHDIKSIAKSQLLEHVLRLFLILGFVFLTTYTLNSWFPTYQDAVNFGIYGAMLAASFAAIMALVITSKSISKFQKTVYKDVLKSSITQEERKKIRNEIIKLCLPTVIISLDITLYLQFDQVTYVKIMETTNVTTDTLSTMGMIANSHKVAMVITAVTSSFNYPLSPAISEAHTLGSYKNLRYTTMMVKSWVMFIATPLLAFMILWSPDIYNIFHRLSMEGSYILSMTTIYIYIWCLYSILDNIMVGINKPLISVYAITIGLILKIIIQFPLTYFLHEYGMLLATILSFIVTYAFLIIATKKYLQMSFTTIFSIQMQVLGLSLLIIMPIKLISLWLPYTITSRVMSFIWCGIWFTLFMVIYVWIQNKYKLIKHLFDYDGTMLSFIKNKILRR